MGLNSKGRTDNLRGKLAEKGLDAIFISQPENRFYLSGFNGSAGYLFISAKQAVLATDFRYVEQSKIQSPDYELLQITGKVEEWFPKLVGHDGIRRLGFEGDNLTFSFNRQLTEALKKAGLEIELMPTDGLVEAIRIIKEPGELDFISHAVKISDDGDITCRPHDKTGYDGIGSSLGNRKVHAGTRKPAGTLRPDRGSRAEFSPAACPALRPENQCG